MSAEHGWQLAAVCDDCGSPAAFVATVLVDLSTGLEPMHDGAFHACAGCLAAIAYRWQVGGVGVQVLTVDRAYGRR